jgi:hypothetical protein
LTFIGVGRGGGLLDEEVFGIGDEGVTAARVVEIAGAGGVVTEGVGRLRTGLRGNHADGLRDVWVGEGAVGGGDVGGAVVGGDVAGVVSRAGAGAETGGGLGAATSVAAQWMTPTATPPATTATPPATRAASGHLSSNVFTPWVPPAAPVEPPPRELEAAVAAAPPAVANEGRAEIRTGAKAAPS